jgi:3',5'-cyclic AMP phosphodiesterase CpdA
MRKLRFIHLSDIHFSNRSAGFGFDPDRAIREMLVADVEEMRGKLGAADAILVTGDIAYSGKRREFEDAAVWLDQVCSAANCGNESVLLCPGNHDVDRSVITNNPLIQDGHDAIRRENTLFGKDRALTTRLVQPDARSLFYSPLAGYNEFAARYQSSFFADAENFAWEHDFPLNDGSTLRVRGLNTALLSGLADFEGGLFLGTRAWTLPRKAGVEYLVMGHHPPSWLADGREANQALDSGARIHLFGHEHEQRVVPGRDWIKMYAGSVNPHRAEPNWRPGYNIIEISVSDQAQRTLIVEVHAREWQGNPPQFRSLEDIDHNPIFRVEIKLREYPKPVARTASPIVSAVPEANIEEPKAALAMDSQHRFRVIVYRFFRLSLSKKNEIVGHLRLVEENDSRLTDVERFKLSLLRAQERQQLEDLEEIIERLERE